MKEPREWDEEYILSLPPGEHNWVEMKGRRTVDLTVSGVLESKVRDDLSKAISALANSGGGVLVLGLKELPSGWAVDDGGVALSIKGKMSTREWLEDVIPNLLEESLVNFNVYVITRGSENSQIEEGRGVLVVEVGDSEQAPHQASDNKYYARVGGKSRPIGHRLVTDIANRRRHPKMVLEVDELQIIKFREERTVAGGLLNNNMFYTPPVKQVIQAQLRARNVGKVFANYVRCLVSFPIGFMDEVDESDVDMIDGGKYVTWSRANTEQDVIGFKNLRPQHGPSRFDPVLPGLGYYWEWEWEWSKGGVNELLSAYGNELIHWEIYADNAPIERGTIRVGDLDVTFVDQTVQTARE